MPIKPIPLVGPQYGNWGSLMKNDRLTETVTITDMIIPKYWPHYGVGHSRTMCLLMPKILKEKKLNDGEEDTIKSLTIRRSELRTAN